ncbi:MAG: hypothetical protein ABJN65_02790 [Parasphingorhabdus sp.]
MNLATLTSSCQCGKVRCEAVGHPIISGVCYCDDCQAGSAAAEALEGAPPVRTSDGGTHYLTYRDDRFSCVKGGELLQPIRTSPDAPTRRMVAGCCNSAMFLKYEHGHWTSAYAVRFDGDIPPIEMRTQVQFRQSGAPFLDEAPRYRTFGVRLFWRLLSSRIAMLFS